MGYKRHARLSSSLRVTNKIETIVPKTTDNVSMDNIDKMLHPEVKELLNAQKISPMQGRMLVRLKQIVDRFAGQLYVLNDEEFKNLTEHYGTAPTIVTWGDYFQLETAYSFVGMTTERSARIIDTIYYDLIAAVKIFQGKPEEFCAEINQNGLRVYDKSSSDWNEQEAEQAHLYILWQYYQEMNLTTTVLSVEDEKWFLKFVPHQSLATA